MIGGVWNKWKISILSSYRWNKKWIKCKWEIENRVCKEWSNYIGSSKSRESWIQEELNLKSGRYHDHDKSLITLKNWSIRKWWDHLTYNFHYLDGNQIN